MQEQKKTSNLLKQSWFYRLIIDNKYTNSLILFILFTIFILLLQRISGLFIPIFDFIEIVALPIIIAAIFHYLTVPLVNFLEIKGVKRVYGAWIVLILIVFVLGLMGLLIPGLIDQASRFISEWQTIWRAYEQEVNRFVPVEWSNQIQLQVNHWISNNSQLSQFNWQDLIDRTLESIGSIVGTVSRITVAIATAPIILFYLLKEGYRLPDNIVRVLPTRMRHKTLHLLKEMNDQISQYIRGQILVAIAVAIMFIIGYQIIGLQYGTIIGVAAGFLNIIPYLGSFLAMLPAFIIAIVMGPSMIVKVAIIFVIEQTIEGRVISPLILGNNLKIHPVTIMFLLIAGGNLFGVIGVIVIIPVYAVIKVVVNHVFVWYKRVSGLYDEEELKESI